VKHVGLRCCSGSERLLYGQYFQSVFSSGEFGRITLVRQAFHFPQKMGLKL